MAEPDEAGLHRGRIDRVQRERTEELLDLLDRLGLRGVADRLADKTAADRVERTARDLEDRPPRGLEGHRATRLRDRRLETAHRRIAAAAGYPDDEPGKVIQPWVEHDDPCELEDAAERRERQHPIRVAELRTDPVRRGGERPEEQDAEHADD